MLKTNKIYSLLFILLLLLLVSKNVFAIQTEPSISLAEQSHNNSDINSAKRINPPPSKIEEIDGEDRYFLVDKIKWRYALEGEQSFNQVRNNHDAQWFDSPDTALTLGLINRTVFVKFSLNVTRFSQVDEYILNLHNTVLSKVSLLHIHPNLYQEEHQSIGMGLPFNQNRFMVSPNNHFALNLHLQGKHDIYLKIEQNGYFDLPLILETPKSAFNARLSENFYVNIFYGFFVALTLYHLFYFFIIRDPVYLSYLFFTTGIAMQFGYMDGILFQNIWPNIPALNEVASKLAIPLISLSIIMLSNNFLQLKNETKVFKYILNFILIINIFTLLITQFISLHISLLISLSVLLFTFICIPFISLAHYLIHRNPISLAYLLSITFFIATCIVITMSILGLTPMDINNLWDTLKMSMGLQMLVFASAIAYKVKVINKERTQAINESKAKSEILARVSHELRTPLNGILGLSDLMKPIIEGSAKSYNVMIHQSATALLTVINDLLDVSKINAGKFSISVQPTDLHDLIYSCAKSLYTQIDETKIKGHVKIDKFTPKYALVDSDRLRQLISNLLGNSIKFTQQGEITLSVEKVPHSAHMFRFIVSDTGVGISEEDMHRIFNPYEKASDNKKSSTNSTGLGLFITQQLAKAMQTQIKAESTVGMGSKFYFEMQLKTCDKPQQSESSQQNTVVKLSILVAEDNEINQLIIQKMLEKMGHDVVMANNGQEALDQLKQQSFDIVFMDCDMPVLNGYDAVKQYREYEKSNALDSAIIYALTAHAYQGHEEKVLECGMNGQLLKPIKPIEIKDLLSSITINH